MVLARNWRCSAGEIDLIATDGLQRLLICEVKTRSGIGYGRPAESVTIAKQRRLRRLAQTFVTETCRGWVSIRFDVISVLRHPDGRPEIDHIEAAF